MALKSIRVLKKAVPVLWFQLPVAALAIAAGLLSPYSSFSDPCWSPDGTKIAYTDHASIWVVDTGDSEQIKISTCGRCPSWSPDGSKIAFLTNTGQVRVMDADGGNENILPVSASSLSWSPDGSTIAFSSQGIWLMDGSGSGTTPLSVSGYSDPAWSPDGSRLAVQCSSENPCGVYIINADGSSLKKLVSNASSPAWSPDGSRIAFCRGTEDYSNIWVFDIVTQGQVNLTRGAGYDYDPAWSPDGTKIAFVSEQGYNTFICVMNSNGTGRRTLVG